MTPRPFLLVLTLLLVVGAIFVIELRLGDPVNTQAADPPPTAGREDGSSPAAGGRTTPQKVQPAGSKEPIGRKEAGVQRAQEIVAPTGFINTEGSR